MKKFNIESGERVKEKRIALKLSRDKLASMAQISTQFLYDIEVGNKGMSAETLFRIAKALNVSTDWILTGEKEFCLN